MRQAIHIFRKDVRYVWRELALLLALIALWAWAAAREIPATWMELLVDIGAAYLIARLIHAETLPGDKQFWLTRPYHRWSLLGAKLMGMVLLVNLPIFAARLFVLAERGYAAGTVLGPLLWSQLLLLFGAMLPIAALAAVTTGLVPFTFALLALFAIAVATVSSVQPPGITAVRLSLNGSAWVWDASVLLALMTFAIVVLLLQYGMRKTWASRMAIAAICLLGIATYLYLPWQTAAAIQTAISPQRFDPKRLRVSLEPASKKVFSLGMLWGPGVQLGIPMKVEGVPAEVELLPDAVSLRFEAADGTAWSSGPYNYPPLAKQRPGPGSAILNAHVDVPAEFFERAKSQPVRLTAELYVSLFGDTQRTTIPIQAAPVDTLRGLRCHKGVLGHLVCRAPFGWPGELIYAEFSSGVRLPFTPFVSYSPFPADIVFDESASRFVSYRQVEREVTIVSHRRLGSFRHTFTVEEFPIAAFSNPFRPSVRKK